MTDKALKITAKSSTELSKPEGNEAKNMVQLFSVESWQSPSIALLLKETSYLEVKFELTNLITKTALYFKIGNTITGAQAEQIADMMIDECRDMKLDQFRVCFRNAMMGKYGKVLGLDGHIFFEWINKFRVEFAAECERRRQGSNNAMKQLEGESIADYAPNVLNEIKKVAQASKPAPAEKKIAKTSQHDLAQSWLEEFDKLHMEQGDTSGVRYVIYHGKHFNQDEWINYKWDEKLFSSMNTGEIYQELKRDKKKSWVYSKPGDTHYDSLIELERQGKVTSKEVGLSGGMKYFELKK